MFKDWKLKDEWSGREALITTINEFAVNLTGSDFEATIPGSPKEAPLKKKVRGVTDADIEKMSAAHRDQFFEKITTKAVEDKTTGTQK